MSRSYSQISSVCHSFGDYPAMLLRNTVYAAIDHNRDVWLQINPATLPLESPEQCEGLALLLLSFKKLSRQTSLNCYQISVFPPHWPVSVCPASPPDSTFWSFQSETEDLFSSGPCRFSPFLYCTQS